MYCIEATNVGESGRFQNQTRNDDSRRYSSGSERGQTSGMATSGTRPEAPNGARDGSSKRSNTEPDENTLGMRSSTLHHEAAWFKRKGRNSHKLEFRQDKPSCTERKTTESKQGMQFLWRPTHSEERSLLCIWQEMQQLRSAEPLFQEVPQAFTESTNRRRR